jgi:sigma-B regulation protein RsbU (phosphoserine phosphatase)
MNSDSYPTEPLSDYHQRPWSERLDIITRMMREVSRMTNPEDMVDVYGAWMWAIQPVDRFIAVSRRELVRPYYRITRSGLWEEQGININPWKQRNQLPMFDHGILGDLLYAEKPVLLGNFEAPKDDPAYEHLVGCKSMAVIPQFEDGVAINMIIALKKEADFFDPEEMPNRMWVSNLFGRATKNLVLNEELRKAYEIVDRELKVVADIQRSLLPTELPRLEGLDIAVHYQTSTQAGGDYYDFFELEDGRLGILIADVSGHGTPAAVMMAVTHSIAHTRDEPPTPPSDLLNFINKRLVARYTNNGTFVTAFYGIYDPKDRTILYCNAGHNPPLVRRADGTATLTLDQNRNLPLGIMADEAYMDATAQLQAGDILTIYTDGITEARSPSDELFGVERLEELLCDCAPDAKAIIETTVKAVNEWTDFAPANDDRTLVVGKLG